MLQRFLLLSLIPYVFLSMQAQAQTLNLSKVMEMVKR